MKNNTILSVIIPVYNSEVYIKELILRLEESRYNKLLEIICVDDGSTDNSLEVLQTIKMTVFNLQVFHQENKGVSAARNLGITKATGVYIYFVDSDDDINVLEFDRALREVVKDVPDLSIFGIKDVFYYPKNKVKTSDTYTTDKTFDQYSFFHDFGILLNKHIMYSPCNKMYRNEILKEHHLLFDENYQFGEDMLFNLQYFYHINKVVMYSNVVYLYRHNETGEESGSTKFYENETDIFLHIVDEIKKLLQAKNMENENKVYLNMFIVRKLSALLNHAYGKNSPLDKIKKIAFIDRLYSEEVICLAIDDNRVKMSEMDQKVLLLLHRRRMKKMINFAYEARNTF